MSQIMQATFTIEIKKVKDSLIALSRMTGRFSKTTVIKIRVLNTVIEISTKGITKRIEANTNGGADISLPVILLKGYLTGSSGGYKTFTFRKGELLCNGSLFSSPAIKFEPVFSNMENVLPVNLNHVTLLQYGLSKSSFEIEKLNLTATIELAQRKMKTNLLEALEFLNQYKVNYGDLEELVKMRLKSEVER
ncbi:hypothetical protein BH11BAC3_BH11BAC3_07600 [soil metagenome]